MRTFIACLIWCIVIVLFAYAAQALWCGRDDDADSERVRSGYVALTLAFILMMIGIGVTP